MKKLLLLFVLGAVLLGTSFSQQPTNPTSGYINGYRYVDLGLSVKWATYNIGARYPAEHGEHFGWGETTPKLFLDTENSVTYGKTMGIIAGDVRFDAARAIWGGTWRLPTLEEIDELIKKCKWQWTEQGRIWGYKVTGPNGRSIFLPTTGLQTDNRTYEEENSGGYWSATPSEIYGSSNAYCIWFRDDFFIRELDARCFGLSIRPVSN